MLTLPGHIVVSNRGLWRGHGGAITVYPERKRAEQIARTFADQAAAGGFGKLTTARAELRIVEPQRTRSAQRSKT